MTSPADAPFVSVIVPCRNEAAFIERSVLSLLRGSYPEGRSEILVVDGMSGDGTRELVTDLAGRHGTVRLLDNPSGRIASALNIGIEASHGEIVVRADAHAEYPPDYIRIAVAALIELHAAGVGGYLRTEPADPGRLARLIASVWSSPFGLGGERSKTRTPDERVHASRAVFGGCFRRELFDRLGRYDERFIGSEDIELYDRILRSGGQLFLVPSLTCRYYLKQGDLQAFLGKAFHNAFWTTYPLRYTARYGLRPRHLAPAAFLLAVVAGVVAAPLEPRAGLLSGLALGTYLLFGVIAFATTSGSLADVASKLAIATAFHFTYAAGSWWGLVRAAIDRGLPVLRPRVTAG